MSAVPPRPGQPDALERIASIDAVRGLVLLVLIVHFNAIWTPPTNLAERAYLFVLQTGMLSMEPFFVMSGFLITGILLKSKGSQHFLGVFYARRALRILPLYFAFIALWFFLVPRLGFADEYSVIGTARTRAFYWLHASNVLWAIRGSAPDSIDHFWSLAVEEQYYLVWPIVVLLCDTRRLKAVCWGMILAAPVVRTFVVLTLSNAAAYTMVFGRMDSLALGGLLAVAARTPEGLRPMVPLARVGAVACGAAGCGIALYTGQIGPYVTLFNTVGLTVSAFLAASITILMLTGSTGSVGHWIVTRSPLPMVGRYCYGIYVLHKPVRTLAEHFGFTYEAMQRVVPGVLLPQLLWTASLTLVSIALAWIAWHALEKQFLKLRRFLPRAGVGRSALDARASGNPAGAALPAPADSRQGRRHPPRRDVVAPDRR